MRFPRLIIIFLTVGIIVLSGTAAQSCEQKNSGHKNAHGMLSSQDGKEQQLDNLYHFKSGDRIIFKSAWDPGMAREDPFYVDPVPEGAVGTVLDVNAKYVRVKMDDSERWPKPLLLWDDSRYNDNVQGGLSCIGKLAQP